MTDIMRIKVEVLMPEAFAPFGEVLSMTAREPQYQGISSSGWKAAYEAGGPSEILMYSSQYSGLRFSVLERHIAVTQAFIPLGRVPSIIAVAAPADGDASPEPGDARAFLLDGSAGYVLKQGAWHSPDRYPLYPPAADIVIITSRETQHELETGEPSSRRLTQVVDFADRGVSFEFEL